MNQPFAFGGKDGTDKLDASVRYRSCLQNYVIDTGSEVILVDTGLPFGTPEESPDETTPIYTGQDIKPYMEALRDLGYQPEQLLKICRMIGIVHVAGNRKRNLMRHNFYRS